MPLQWASRRQQSDIFCGRRMYHVGAQLISLLQLCRQDRRMYHVGFCFAQPSSALPATLWEYLVAECNEKHVKMKY